MDNKDELRELLEREGIEDPEKKNLILEAIAHEGDTSGRPGFNSVNLGGNYSFPEICIERGEEIASLKNDLSWIKKTIGDLRDKNEGQDKRLWGILVAIISVFVTLIGGLLKGGF